MTSYAPVHWVMIPLDKYALLMLKDPDTANWKVTYKIVDAEGHILEGPKVADVELKGGDVAIGSSSITWKDYQRSVNILKAD